MPELINVPVFLYRQYDPGSGYVDDPILVSYYRDSLLIQQNDHFISIDYDHLESFLKEMRKHKKKAEEIWSKR